MVHTMDRPHLADLARTSVEEIKTKYWSALEGRHKPGAFSFLNTSYSDPRRGYHSWRHIATLLHRAEEVAYYVTRPDLVKAAIFWHDVVYLTRDAEGRRRSDLENVKDSAEAFLNNALWDEPDKAAIHEMILATADHLGHAASDRYAGFSTDLDFFLDIDLSPLAASWQEFSANLEAIRFEFSWMAEPLFWLNQRAVLDRFARSERIYRHEESRRNWEKQARKNIARCIEQIEREGYLREPLRGT